MAGEIGKPHDHLFQWPGVPRYRHLLVDQTRLRPEEVRGALHGRIAQLAMMAAYRESGRVLRDLVPLLAALVRVAGMEDVRQIVVYLAITTRGPERWRRFAEAVRRQVSGGGDLMNKVDVMVDIYGEMRAREGRQEGRQEGQLATIAAKRFKKVANATAVVWKMLLVAERKFRRINSPELLPAVAAGQQYHDGLPIKAGQHQEAAA